MSFTDMRSFLRFLPDSYKTSVKADFDHIDATVRGFHVGVNVAERIPYSRIELKDSGAPFEFNVRLLFDPAQEPGKTDFHIEVSAELNLMMKMMLGSRLKDAMDKIVDGLVDVSNGKMPQGLDLSRFGMNV